MASQCERASDADKEARRRQVSNTHARWRRLATDASPCACERSDQPHKTRERARRSNAAHAAPSADSSAAASATWRVQRSKWRRPTHWIAAYAERLVSAWWAVRRRSAAAHHATREVRVQATSACCTAKLTRELKT